MPLVTVLRPESEAELAIALAILEAHGIESFVHGRYLGSLLPGLQIESYNTRSIMVLEDRAGEAKEALAELAETGEDPVDRPQIAFRDKVRVVLEAFLFGWFVPAGRKSK